MNYLSEQSENDDYRKPTKMTDTNILKIPKNVRLRFCRENFSSKQPVADSLFTGAQSAILKLSTGICMVCLFSNLSAFMRTHSAPDNLEMQTDAQKVTLFESLFSASGKSSWRKTHDGYNHIKRAHNKESFTFSSRDFSTFVSAFFTESNFFFSVSSDGLILFK